MCSLIKDQISTYEAAWSKISNLNPIKLLDPPINLQEKNQRQKYIKLHHEDEIIKKKKKVQRFQLIQEIN